MILQDQKQISPYRGLPSDSLGQSATAVTITGETVQLYYNNAGTLTADAGQAAGTAVLGVLAYDYSLDKIQSCQARFGDASLTFTSTAFTTEVFIPPEELEKGDALNWKQRLSTFTSSLSNGQYVVDYRDGVLYGKKASTQTTLTSTSYVIAGTANVVSGGNVAAGSTDSGNPVKVGAVYNSTAPTYTTGQRTDLQADSQGNLQSNLFTKIAGEDLTNDVMKCEEQFSYTNITLAAPTTTVVKSGAGLLHCIQINKAVATGVITVYDNTAASGTVIATITQPAAVLATTQNCLYDVKFNTGLTVVTSTAAQDITVSTR